MTWDAVRVAALTAAPLLLAAGFWLSYLAMGALFGPSPVPYLPPAAVSSPPAPAKAHHPPPHHRRRVVPRASVAPVTAVPVRSRQPARTVTPTPAFTTLRPTESVSPTPASATATPEPSTASPEPSTATPTPTPPLPGDGSGT